MLRILSVLVAIWFPAFTAAELLKVDDLEVNLLLSEGGPVISLDLQDADLGSVLRLFSKIAERNIVAAKGDAGKVSLRLKDVPFSQAFDVLLKAEELYAVTDGSVTIVYPRDKFPELWSSFSSP